MVRQARYEDDVENDEIVQILVKRIEAIERSYDNLNWKEIFDKGVKEHG